MSYHKLKKINQLQIYLVDLQGNPYQILLIMTLPCRYRIRKFESLSRLENKWKGYIPNSVLSSSDFFSYLLM